MGGATPVSTAVTLSEQGADPRRYDAQNYTLHDGSDYRAHASLCLSSVTAARIAAATLMVRAAFAAGVRSSVAPISSANIISAASIAAAARSVTFFATGPWSIGGIVHVMWIRL
jgi:hypothetical protein